MNCALDTCPDLKAPLLTLISILKDTVNAVDHVIVQSWNLWQQLDLTAARKRYSNRAFLAAVCRFLLRTCPATCASFHYCVYRN